jgi:hypothetical protein
MLSGVSCVRRLQHAAICVLGIAAGSALGADTQVQQQLQQREQQQMELRLKMQQQLDRAMQAPQGVQVPPALQAPSPAESADLKRLQLERAQQQRLQQLHEQQSRRLIAPTPPGQTGLELERQRALQGGSQELKNLEFQRRMETDRAAP